MPTQRVGVVERPVAASQAGRTDYGALNVGAGTIHCRFNLEPLGEACGNRRG